MGALNRVGKPAPLCAVLDSQQAGACPAGVSGMFRLLIVDDDRFIVHALSRIAEAEGFTVVATTDPREAVRLLGEGEPFPLVVSDYMMPALNGVEVLKVARERNPEGIRMLLTAASDFRVAVDAVNQSEVFRLVGKPWGHADLVATLRGAAETWKLRQENRQLNELVHGQNRELQVLNRQLEQLVVERTNNLLDGLISALDYRDAETQWHSRRVSKFTRHIAARLVTDAKELGDIEMGALLHDIGKIAVRDAILRKAGPLTPDEWEEMREHPEAGWRMLQRIPYLSEASRIVLQHQERWDGMGYPARLKGKEICLGARLFAVADTYDAITSNRPYRAAQPHDLAVAEIRRCAGSQFDPDVVDAFASVPETEWLRIRAEVDAEATAELAAGIARPLSS